MASGDETPTPRSTFLARRSGFRTSQKEEIDMRDQPTYNRCATRGCPFLIPAPMNYCRDHAADVVVTEHLDVRGLLLD